MQALGYELLGVRCCQGGSCSIGIAEALGVEQAGHHSAGCWGLLRHQSTLTCGETCQGVLGCSCHG